ncbi:hypothetical protein GCM10022224_010080 [Nonomuraea antimicrobica]|uniref:YbaB/EbfC DNA-binding family protein n=1 Tax=Nonomuraea antimicrobica TaxID=561173 RepID=A0ABP7B4W6_9ACTN
MPEFDPAAVTPEDLEKMLRRAEETMAKLEAAADGFHEVTGEGTAADGKIQATVESDGMVKEIRLDPRTLRTMGVEELAEAIVAALREAQLSARGQLEARLAAVQGEELGSFDMGAAGRGLEDIQSSFLSSLRTDSR